MRILVSACLLGYNCKYNGKNNLNKKIVELLKDHEVIPVCPEMLGGLCCPRIPCEKVGDRIWLNRYIGDMLIYSTLMMSI